MALFAAFAESSMETHAVVFACFAECSGSDSRFGFVWVFGFSLSIERRVCGFFQDVVDENGNEGFLEDSIYLAH
jgi:hypothetical protein